MENPDAVSRPFKRSGTLFSLLVLLHALCFLGFWLTNAHFYAATNDYLADLLGAPLDYIRLCLSWAVLIVAWSTARLVPPRFRGLAWLYLLLGGIFIIFFYGSFWMLFRESPVQALRLQHLIVYFRIGLDILLLAGLVILLSAWRRRAGRSCLHLVAVFVVYLFAWLLPLVWLPGNVYSHSLPARPLIIAHRGASMLAPENTLAAMRLAVQLGAFGLESDLQLSADGAWFLMHDDTLERTTNVSALFPGRQDQPAATFLLAELRQLNASEWFVVQDPYRAIARHQVTPDRVAEYQNQKVPTLEEMLEVVRQSGTVFIFDLKQSSSGDMTGGGLFELAFQEIQAAGIDPQIWFLADPQQAQFLRIQAPAMLRVSGVNYRRPLDPADQLAGGYQVVNAEYGLSPEWIGRYHAAGLRVNLYTVEEAWLFSRLWLLGVDSITTSNAGVMLDLARPLLALSYARYLFLWSLLGVCGLIWMVRSEILNQRRL